MVICYGKTPSGAADWAIKEGLVESERCSIVAIPPQFENRMATHVNRLLSQDEIEKCFGDLPLIKREKA